MTAYNVISPAAMVTGQTEDISVILANLNAIAAVLNGGLDNANINAAAAIVASKLANYPTDVTKVLRGDGTWGERKATGAFSAYLGTHQAMTDTVWTKVAMNIEEFDVSAWFDSTTANKGRYTPLIAGYYRFSGALWLGDAGLADQARAFSALYKNGALYKIFQSFNSSGAVDTNVSGGSAMAFANGTTDYFEIWGHLTGAGKFVGTDSSQTYFQGELIGV